MTFPIVGLAPAMATTRLVMGAIVPAMFAMPRPALVALAGAMLVAAMRAIRPLVPIA